MLLLLGCEDLMEVMVMVVVVHIEGKGSRLHRWDDNMEGRELVAYTYIYIYIL